MFNLERFVEECRAAVQADPTHKAAAEVMARAFRDPGAIATALGEPTGPALTPIYKSADLTIINLVWKPSITVQPHNHEMWAVIGIYGGREDNIFWRRIKDDPAGRIEAAGAKSLGPKDVRPLGDDIIHSVSNPTSKLTGAIHVYGGDFFSKHRSEWETEGLEERDYDIEKNIKLFERANR